MVNEFNPGDRVHVVACAPEGTHGTVVTRGGRPELYPGYVRVKYDDGTHGLHRPEELKAES